MTTRTSEDGDKDGDEELRPKDGEPEMNQDEHEPASVEFESILSEAQRIIEFAR